MVSEFTNLIDLNDMPVKWWNEVLALGSEICDAPEKYAHECDGKIMATLFYEPSTRTHLLSCKGRKSERYYKDSFGVRRHYGNAPP